MRIFVAGATGATGQVFVPMATTAGHELVLHVRPKTADKSPLGRDLRARIFDLEDAATLQGAMEGCDVVLSLVGTMRSRFVAGDTYASSDVASTRQLTNAAEAAGKPRFLLLTSFGAGGAGAYLKMKGECEAIVRASTLRWTIFRPAQLVSPDDAKAPTSLHGKREAPPAIVPALFHAIGALPGLGGWAADAKPIPIEVLCRAFLRVIETPRDGEVLKGRELWALGGSSC